MIDYYNELPQMVHIIDNMNQELADIQKKYEELEEKYNELKKKFKAHKDPAPLIQVRVGECCYSSNRHL